MNREDQFIPHLIVSDGPAAVEFYKTAFGAEVGHQMMAPDGKRLMHGELTLDGHKIFVTAAPALRFFVTAVQLPPDARAPSGYVAYAIVEAPAQGLSIEPTWRGALSQRTGGSDDVHFERVFVPETHVVEKRVIGGNSSRPGLNG